MTRVHGGADALGQAIWDFSSNANACGPCPMLLDMLREVDARHYPDPSYRQLSQMLASFHGVSPERIVLAASASEFIQRLTAWRWREGARRVWIPSHAYGDYAHAAQAWGMARVAQTSAADLAWLCDPGSPLGQNESARTAAELLALPWMHVALDCAYAPMRLSGEPALSAAQRDRCWQIWSPNKALGMTGIRGAYAVAPVQANEKMLAAMASLAPSWPLGTHGEAMLRAWAKPEVQAWVQATLSTLGDWKGQLEAMLMSHGWRLMPSCTPYLCGRPPHAIDAGALRAAQIKLRDTTSFGLPGWWRMSAQAPQAIGALAQALAQALDQRGQSPQDRREA